MDDFLRHLESQRKSATKMIKLARKMKAQAILIRKQLRRTA